MKKHHRKSIRLKNHDYAQKGMYFVTVCVHGRKCILGDVCNGEMVLNECGKITDKCWNEIPKHFPRVVLDRYIIMPNHVHGIINMRRGTACRAPTGERFGKPVSGSVPTIVRSFKSAVTKRINEIRKTPCTPIWQRNYHEHIVRDGSDLIRIQQYINENPSNWDNDRNNPKNWNNNPKPKHRIGFHEK